MIDPLRRAFGIRGIDEIWCTVRAKAVTSLCRVRESLETAIVAGIDPDTYPQPIEHVKFPDGVTITA